MTDMIIAMNLETRRLYARGPGRKVYQWLKNKYNELGTEQYPYPVLLEGREPRLLTEKWTLDWEPK